MEIRQIENINEWEEFNKKQLHTLFVQSLSYGNFYGLLGESHYIFGIYNNNQLIGGALVLTTHAKRGNFLYIPYGPILPENNKKEALTLFTSFLKEFAQKDGDFSFIRVSPFLINNEENRFLFKSLGYVNAPMHVLAEHTWILDLSLSEDELLFNMNKNHRNLIRRCIREKVRVEKNTTAGYLDKFLEIYKDTANRHKFFKFSDEYVRGEFGEFAGKNEVLVWDAYLPDNSLDSSAVIMYYGSMAAYRHGASKNLNKKLPTSYLLQWEAILEAKNRGMKYYNFWGIAPENSPKHPFFGITHFKKGFGGYALELLHCQDIPLNNKYYLNWTIESIRRIKRGF